MDERFLLLARVFGYMLNVLLFLAVSLKFPHHRVALGAWMAWMIVAAVAVMVRYAGYLNEYLVLVDYVSMPLLYVNAVIAAWALLAHTESRKQDK